MPKRMTSVDVARLSVCTGRVVPWCYRALWRRSVMKTLLAVTIAVITRVAFAGGGTLASTRDPLADTPGVFVVVAPVSDEMRELGMTDFVFAVEIERRLKEVGIAVLQAGDDRPTPGNPTLWLIVTAVPDDSAGQCAYAVRLEFTQTVLLQRDPSVVIENSPTWSAGRVGFHRSDWRRVMINDVVSVTDEFIEAYFAANPQSRR